MSTSDLCTHAHRLSQVHMKHTHVHTCMPVHEVEGDRAKWKVVKSLQVFFEKVNRSQETQLVSV